MPSIATIGYEGATIETFLHALREEGVELVVDIRAVARSRRPGFAKTRLAENLAGAGIGYLHLKALGTPADGRAAARAGEYATLHEIYSQHLDTADAQDGLEVIAELVRSRKRLCLLCFEAEPAHCHRSLVAAALKSIVAIDVHHLAPKLEPIE